MKISYNWLKWYIPEIPEAEKLRDIFTYHLCEVESISQMNADWIFDLNILPNRAHDLLSHHGIARELAGQLGIEFKDPSPMYKVPESKPTKLEIDIQTPKCRRFMGRIVRDVKVGDAPAWVREHLEAIGQRSINSLVDASNIVMYDCGQPNHVFDLDQIKGEKLIIREAKAGEKIVTLKGEEIVLKEGDVVVADEEKILSLAGVRGGNTAEINEHTKNILIEVASFDPVAVRKTSRRVGVLTDSSKRFENDLSPELAPFAMKEISGLLVEYGEREFEEIVDIYPQVQETREVKFSLEKIAKILGREVASTEVEQIFKNYSFEYDKKGDDFTLKVPSLRLDLEIEEDIAEEIGRISGYDKVEGVLPTIDFKPKIDETFAMTTFARAKLEEDGYSEVITYTFCNKGEVRVLQSPSDKKFLRTNLTDGLKASYEYNRLNAPLLQLEEVKIFEIGTVFTKNAEEVRIAYNKGKNIVEHTLREFCESENFSLSNFFSGPRFPEPGSARPFEKIESEKFKLWSIYPFISRDVAVWIPSSQGSENLEKILKEEGTELLIIPPYLFDSFTKDGRTSYGFRMVFQSTERTLKDDEINEIMDKIGLKIRANPDWELR